jgi:hypothetical protein
MEESDVMVWLADNHAKASAPFGTYRITIGSIWRICS